MNKHQIPYSTTGYFPQLILDYIAQSPNVKEFYGQFPNKEGFAKQIESRSQLPVNRTLLADVITEQYEKLNTSEKTRQNIELLGEDSTFTVTTGHQLNVFTGPLYFVHKIISTINLAERLKRDFPNNNFVPIYWMHTEDHDFAEINHIHLFGKRVEWKGDYNYPAGFIDSKGLESTIAELNEIMGGSENAQVLKGLFCAAYMEHDNLADATAYLANELFGEYGLVVFEPNDNRLKQEFVPQLKEEIFNQSNSPLVEQTNAQLDNKGYKVQVNPREINCFYIDQERRSRIVQDGEVLKVLDSDLQFTRGEMEELIEKEPFHISANVVLRPMYQETILPNIAYVGGAGELSYWLQYKAMFEKNGVSYPILVLRNSVLVINKGLAGKIEKTGLSLEQLFKDADLLVNEFVSQNTEREINLDGEKEEISKTYASLQEKAEKVDPTLGPRVQAELANHIKSIEKLEDKLRKAEKAKFETSINQIKGIKDKLFPERSLQERYDNFIPFYLQYGKGFIKTLKDHLNPLEEGFTILLSQPKS